MFSKYKNRNDCRGFTSIGRAVVVMASSVATLRSGFGNSVEQIQLIINFENKA